MWQLSNLLEKKSRFLHRKCLFVTLCNPWRCSINWYLVHFSEPGPNICGNGRQHHLAKVQLVTSTIKFTTPSIIIVHLLWCCDWWHKLEGKISRVIYIHDIQCFFLYCWSNLFEIHIVLNYFRCKYQCFINMGNKCKSIYRFRKFVLNISLNP